MCVSVAAYTSARLSNECVCVRACVRAFVRACVRGCVSVSLCVYVYVCVCVCARAHALATACVYMCTRALVQARGLDHSVSNKWCATMLNQSMALYNKDAPALYTEHEHLRRLAAARAHFSAAARGPAMRHYLQLLHQVFIWWTSRARARARARSLSLSLSLSSSFSLFLSHELSHTFSLAHAPCKP